MCAGLAVENQLLRPKSQNSLQAGTPGLSLGTAGLCGCRRPCRDLPYPGPFQPPKCEKIHVSVEAPSPWCVCRWPKWMDCGCIVKDLAPGGSASMLRDDPERLGSVSHTR